MTRDELVARLIGVNLRFRMKIRQRPTRTSTEASTASTALDGVETDYAGLTNYFKSIRAAFEDRSIRRGIIVAEPNYIASRIWSAA